MAISYIQGIHNRSLTTITLTGVTAGNALVMCETSANAIISIVDSTGDTWIHPSPMPAVYNLSGVFNADIWYVGNASSGSHTLTLTMTNGFSPWHELLEFSGVDHTTPVYGAAVINNQDGTFDDVGPNLTSTSADDMFVACSEKAGDSQWDAPWINPLISGEGAPGGGDQYCTYYAPGSAGTYHATDSVYKNFLCSAGIVLKASTPITIVQSSDTSSLSGITTGNFVLVAIGNQDNPTSISDGLGNSYTRAVLSTFFGFASIWYSSNVTGGNAAITWSGNTGTSSVIIVELSGVGAVGSAAGAGSNFPNQQPYGPSLTTTNTSDFLLSFIYEQYPAATLAPWTPLYIESYPAGQVSSGYYAPGTVGSERMNDSSGGNQYFVSSGIVLQAASPVLTLNLNDSVSLNDSISPSFEIDTTVSDTVTVSDSAPNSFSVQSDFIAPVSTPVMEQLVIQLAPANVKLYFIIEE